MISMQQLEELEARVVKALQLIGDLRSENSKLENDNEHLKGEIEEVKLTLEEKEQEIAKIKRELDNSTRELNEIKERGEVLEKKIVGLLGKLDVIQSGDIPLGESPKTYTRTDSEPIQRTRPAAAVHKEEIVSKTVYVEETFADEAVAIERQLTDDEEDFVLQGSNEAVWADEIDDGASLQGFSGLEDEDETPIIGSSTLTEEDVYERETIESSGEQGLLDDDYIVIIDDDDEVSIMGSGDELSGGDVVFADDDIMKSEGIEDEEDFLIIEDDEDLK